LEINPFFVVAKLIQITMFVVCIAFFWKQIWEEPSRQIAHEWKKNCAPSDCTHPAVQTGNKGHSANVCFSGAYPTMSIIPEFSLPCII
jgi:hypothetical protein